MRTKHLFFLATIAALALSCKTNGGGDNPDKDEDLTKDSTYMRVDYDDLGERFEDTIYAPRVHLHRGEWAFSPGPDLPVKASYLQGINPAISGSLALFQLDTVNQNSAGYRNYRPHPMYFDSLQSIRMNSDALKKGRHPIGGIKPALLETGLSYQDIITLLIQFPIIQTYSHLHADLVVKEKQEDDSLFSITYRGKWHYCTNDCYSPKIRFGVEVDKASGQVTVIKK